MSQAVTDNQRISSQILLPGKGNRACLECRRWALIELLASSTCLSVATYQCCRKKTKCDMIQPVCGLCLRVRSSCTYPKRKKQHVSRSSTPRGLPNSYKQHLGEEPVSRFENLADSLEYLVNLLDNRLKDGHDDLDPLMTLATNKTENETEGQHRINVTANTDSLETSEVGNRIQFENPFEESSPITTQNIAATAANEVQTDNGLSSTYSLELPKDLAEELIHLFFEKIQLWLPLLHKPRFMAYFMTESPNTLYRMDGYSVEETMLHYGIFSLASRFSNHPALIQLNSFERSISFAETAHQLYDKARLAIEPSTLPYLQGCILLVFCMYTQGPSPRGWIITGVCVRMAYDLGIGSIDADFIEESPDASDASRWTDKEELRRAWWLVWELDRFGSIISKRPYAIDQRRMAVKLPVSDEAWFFNTPVESVVLRTKPAEAWKTLCDSENQDARAWFLVANHLMAFANDIAHANEVVPEKEKKELTESITCYALILPRSYCLDKVPFTNSNSTESNFIISIHLMLMSARNALLVHEGRKGFEESSPSLTSSTTDFRYPYRDELPHIISKWPPEYIPLSHPFIACMMIPLDLGSLLPSASDKGLLEDMAMLVLSIYSEHWQIGKILLR
jgi:hypothetical protein